MLTWSSLKRRNAKGFPDEDRAVQGEQNKKQYRTFFFLSSLLVKWHMRSRGNGRILPLLPPACERRRRSLVGIAESAD